jgi:hypothetical protein
MPNDHDTGGVIHNSDNVEDEDFGAISQNYIFAMKMRTTITISDTYIATAHVICITQPSVLSGILIPGGGKKLIQGLFMY